MSKSCKEFLSCIEIDNKYYEVIVEYVDGTFVQGNFTNAWEDSYPDDGTPIELVSAYILYEGKRLELEYLIVLCGDRWEKEISDYNTKNCLY